MTGTLAPALDGLPADGLSAPAAAVLTAEDLPAAEDLRAEEAWSAEDWPEEALGGTAGGALSELLPEAEADFDAG